MEYLPLLFFVAVMALLLAGYPVAFSLGGASVVFGIFIFGMKFFELLPLRVWGIMSNYVLIAVPLFIFMGLMFEKSGIAEELLETMALLFGKLKGGLAFAVLFVGAMLGASTGIVGATIITMGVLSLPVMLHRGCAKTDSTGIIAASGTLGQIIPPSIILILLGSVLNVSVGDLFIAAVVPGLLLVGLYFFWIVFRSYTKAGAFPAMPDEELEKFNKAGKAKRVITAFVMPALLILMVLGSIFAGIASPTEAAAVGALGATLLTIYKKKFNMETLRYVMRRTLSVTSMAFMILVGATAFSLVFRGMHGDRIITDLIHAAELAPHHFLLIVLVVIFLAGFIIDFIEIIFIIVPIVTPVFISFNIDLLWVGIIIAMNLQTSFLTPPFGFALFFLKGVSPPGVTTGDIYKGIIPYVLLQLLALLLVISFPEIVTWLPALLR